MAGDTLTRRPIASRDTNWARHCAAWLARSGIRPNAISVASVFSAAFAGVCIIVSSHFQLRGRAALLVLAIVFIVGRLLCNMFDGMVAVEGGMKSKSGEIFNELPDRLADLIVLVCAGYAETNWPITPVFGWAAGSAAVVTAYVRTLGASAGASQQFCGPMAKQQRMFLTCVACLVAAVKSVAGWTFPVFPVALLLITLGCVVTSVRRAMRIVRELERK
jgi:phosphatidylglycerophosphate synthase